MWKCKYTVTILRDMQYCYIHHDADKLKLDHHFWSVIGSKLIYRIISRGGRNFWQNASHHSDYKEDRFSATDILYTCLLGLDSHCSRWLQLAKFALTNHQSKLLNGTKTFEGCTLKLITFSIFLFTCPS